MVEVSNSGVTPQPAFGNEAYSLRSASLDKQQLASVVLENAELLLEHP